MQNPGLVHLAEEIFDYVGNADLLKIMEVSKTCYAFVNQYGRNRLAKKLNSILARKHLNETSDGADHGCSNGC